MARRLGRRVALLLAGTLAVTLFVSAFAADRELGDDAVWAALRAPGTVVVLRHSYAPGSFDPPDARLDDCSTQRNLDDSGRAQAKRLGDAFRAHAIAIGRVLSSPRCRCLETARLVFGRGEAWDVLQGALRDTELRRRRVAEIRRAIDAHRDGPALILVTHGAVISDITGLTVQMGAFVVLRREPRRPPHDRGLGLRRLSRTSGCCGPGSRSIIGRSFRIHRPEGDPRCRRSPVPTSSPGRWSTRAATRCSS
jgi:broad specificity phosphatase PhoE